MTTAVITTPPIVSAVWLAEHIGTVMVVDTRRVDEYLDGHVPGAASFPLATLMVEDTSRSALERLGLAAQQALAARGIAPDAHVVLIDDNDGSASLGALICELAGLTRVSTVHGGMRAWAQENGEIETLPATREATTFDVPVSLRSIAPVEDVQAAFEHGTARLVDARSQLEFEGIVGSPCCACRGHIPGSVHFEWTALLAATGDLLGPERVREEAHHVGLSEQDPIIVYCHSGQRAATAALALRAAGFTNVRHSLGSWHEWSHRGLPVGPEA